MFSCAPINLLDFVISISSAIDFIDPPVAHHHKSVAYIASNIGREVGLPTRSQYDLTLAGLLHDIGVLPENERVHLLQFDHTPEANQHCEVGHRLLNKFKHF